MPPAALLMDWEQQCAAVIPAFDEAPTLATVVADVRLHLPAVLVVNDGSRDDTASVAVGAGARVISHSQRRGKGAALRTGLGAARASGYGWALTLDGDGQHDPSDIPLLLEAASRSGAALIIGNRLENPAGMSFTRRVVNRWMSRRLSRRTGVACPDSQCGMRLLDLETWAQRPSTANHFEVESEMLVNFVRAGRAVVFVPVRNSPARRPSRIRPVTDTVRWLCWWRRGR